MEGCAECSVDSGKNGEEKEKFVCSKCEIGFELDENRICKKCAEGFFRSSDVKGDQCIPCSQREDNQHCKVCDGETGECTQCMVGYFMYAVSFLGCGKCHPSCKECVGELQTQCISCQEGKELVAHAEVLAGGKCCTKGCTDCEYSQSEASECKACPSNRYLNLQSDGLTKRCCESPYCDCDGSGDDLFKCGTCTNGYEKRSSKCCPSKCKMGCEFSQTLNAERASIIGEKCTTCDPGELQITQFHSDPTKVRTICGTIPKNCVDVITTGNAIDVLPTGPKGDLDIALPCRTCEAGYHLNEGQYCAPNRCSSSNDNNDAYKVNGSIECTLCYPLSRLDQSRCLLPLCSRALGTNVDSCSEFRFKISAITFYLKEWGRDGDDLRYLIDGTSDFHSDKGDKRRKAEMLILSKRLALGIQRHGTLA